MAQNTDKKVSKAEVSRVVTGWLQASDAERLAGLKGLSQVRTSKTKLQTREQNRLEAKYGAGNPMVARAKSKLDANATYVGGLRMAVNRAAAGEETCPEGTWMVTGYVYDKHGGPVTGARVTVYRSDGNPLTEISPVETDASGHYKISYTPTQPKPSASGEQISGSDGQKTVAGATTGQADTTSDQAGTQASRERLSINAAAQPPAVYVRAADPADETIYADSTPMQPNLGTCNYRDLVLNLDRSMGLVSDVDKDRRASRYLGNSSTREFHDLQNEKAACQIDEMRIDHCMRFKSQREAASLGYDKCAYCFGASQSKR